MPQVATCRPDEPEFLHDPHEFYIKRKTRIKRVNHEVTRTQTIAWLWCLGGHPIPPQEPIVADNWLGAVTNDKSREMDEARRNHHYALADLLRAELMAEGWVLSQDNVGRTILTRETFF